MSIMKHALLLIVCIFLVASCKQKNTNEQAVPNDMDLKEIVATDTLRVATMYGSTSYFMYRDELMGFDYELTKNLAKHLKLNLKITIANNETELIQLLENGNVDLISYNLIETKELKKQFTFVLPQPESYQVLVQNMGVNVITNVTELAGKTIHVQENSIFHKRLKALSDEIGGSIKIALVPDSVSNEDLIDSVGERKFEYTLAFHNVALLHKTYYRRLDCRTPVGFEQRNGWLIRTENSDLKRVIQKWQDSPEIKELQNQLFEKYWEHSPYFAFRKVKIPKGAISPYDRFFKKYAPQIDWDWRLLAAVAYHESKFDPSQRSWAGAQGLMQLMPRTAANFGLNKQSVLDPELNIEASVQYIKSLNLSFRKVQSKDERIKFILAGYNSGPAHILDAMALAQKYGKNPQVWFGNVEYFLLKKSEPQYYNDKVVKYGYFRGNVTVRYVQNTLDTYRNYLSRR